jgi:hypothetical protein
MANAGKTKRRTTLRGNKTRSDRSGKIKKSKVRAANGMLGDNSLTSVTNNKERPNENNRRNLPLKHENTISEEEVTESIPVSNTNISTRFICKVCGNTFDNQELLNEHTSKLHPPKREVTANQIIERVFEGKLNFPKTKAELVKYIEVNKDKEETITLDVIDTLREIPDRRYNDVADLVLGLEQQRGNIPSS